MQVVLKPEYKKEPFISQINIELVKQFGASGRELFMMPSDLKKEISYYNSAKGSKYFPHLERPLTGYQLESNAFWLRVGEYHLKLSSPDLTLECVKDGIAVCKWITFHEAKYIDESNCYNFLYKDIAPYLDNHLMQNGINPGVFWEQKP